MLIASSNAIGKASEILGNAKIEADLIGEEYGWLFHKKIFC